MFPEALVVKMHPRDSEYHICIRPDRMSQYRYPLATYTKEGALEVALHYLNNPDKLRKEYNRLSTSISAEVLDSKLA